MIKTNTKISPQISRRKINKKYNNTRYAIFMIVCGLIFADIQPSLHLKNSSKMVEESMLV